MTDRIVGGKRRVLQRAAVRKDGWTVNRRALFLDTLIATCNVRKSAKAAGINASNAYALRNRDPTFAMLWRQALALGYEQLEEALLSYALEGVNALTIEPADDDETDDNETDDNETGDGHAQSGRNAAAPLKLDSATAQLALNLLNRHRATVEGRAVSMRTRHTATAADTDAALRKKLDSLARQIRGER